MSGFGLRDATSVALFLSVCGAAHLVSKPLMSAVPDHIKPVKKAVWRLFGSVVSCVLFLVIRLVNKDRAMTAERAIAKLVRGSAPSSAPSSSRAVSPLPIFAAVALLGYVAASNSLNIEPYDFKALFPMLCLGALGLTAGSAFLGEARIEQIFGAIRSDFLTSSPRANFNLGG